MATLDPGFEGLLSAHKLEDLEAHAGAVYAVWADYRLAYMNPAWYKFAAENGGEPSISSEWTLGRSMMDCVAGEVKEFYEERFRACLELRSVWSHEYECSSDEVYRLHHQIVYPLGEGGGILLVNSLVVEGPHGPGRKPVRVEDESVYIDSNGFFCQCAFCRRMKNFLEAERWDWVPEWAKESPEHTSHTFCPTCYRHYYPTAPVGGH